MKIYLDDIRNPPEGWILFRPNQINDFISACEHAEEISMDHDLGLDETGKEYLNGYQITKILHQKVVYNGWWKDNVPKITIHSSNVVGKLNMLETFRAIKVYLEVV